MAFYLMDPLADARGSVLESPLADGFGPAPGVRAAPSRTPESSRMAAGLSECLVEKKLRTGAGGGVPRTAIQRISFNSSSSMRSASLQSSLSERAAVGESPGFR
jgi:hypothetical protein